MNDRRLIRSSRRLPTVRGARSKDDAIMPRHLVGVRSFTERDGDATIDGS
jgi:hypothetical protein